MSRPMPSPRGTNFERLYISSSPSAAYDSFNGLTPSAYGRAMARKLTSRHGMAMDLELPEQAVNARQNELDEGDAEVEASITSLVQWCKQNLSEKDITGLVNQLLDNNGAQDEPAPFPGRPRPNGKAMDARPRVHAMTTAEKHRLDEMVPGLARIKCL